MKIEQQIYELLEKFYKGETSLDEEKRLAVFFQSEDLPQSLETDRKVFLSLTNEQVPVPDELEQKISSLIDLLEIENKSNKATLSKRLVIPLIAIAASVLLVFGIGIFVTQKHPHSEVLADTYQNPDEAYRATIDALQLFSENFSKGMQPIEKANAEIEKTQKIIQQTIHTKQ